MKRMRCVKCGAVFGPYRSSEDDEKENDESKEEDVEYLCPQCGGRMVEAENG